MSILDRNSGMCVLALMLIVVLAGIVYSVHLGNSLRFPDEEDYYCIATHVASSCQYSLDGQNPNIFRPPGYPLFLSVLVLCGAGVIILRIANFILLAGVMYFAARLVRSHATPRAGVFAALGILGYPALFYTAGTLFPQTLGALLLLITLCLLTASRPHMGHFIGAGAAFGLLTLAIPLSLPLLLPLGIGTCLGRGRAFKKGFLSVLVVCLIPVFAWCVRDYVTFGAPIFISANSGLNLLLGNCENAAPDSGSTTDIRRYRREAIDAGLTFVQRDAYYRSKALEWIRDHKRQAAVLFCRKFFNYFNYSNALEVSAETSSLKDMLMLITYMPLLALVILRFVLARHYAPSRLDLLLAVLYLANAFLYSIYFTRIRFRMPFDVLLICMAATFLEMILRQRVGVAMDSCQAVPGTGAIPLRRRGAEDRISGGISRDCRRSQEDEEHV